MAREAQIEGGGGGRANKGKGMGGCVCVCVWSRVDTGHTHILYMVTHTRQSTQAAAIQMRNKVEGRVCEGGKMEARGQIKSERRGFREGDCGLRLVECLV